MPEVKPGVIGPSFIELQQIDSTNNYARQLIPLDPHPNLPLRQEWAGHGTAIFAHEQIAGKGQFGKTWISPKGESILMSILVNTASLHFADQFRLSICASVSLHEFFSAYAATGVTIKWPNDLYAGNKKAGGILIENIVKQDQGNTEWPWAVVGFGVNINQTKFPGHLSGAISLKQVTGKNFNTIQLAKDLHKIFLENFERLERGEFENLYNRYLSHLYKLNETANLKKGPRVFSARIKTVLASGKLVVQHGIEEEFSAGEIEWVS